MRNHGGKGKGTKRKAETNFVDAYGGASELAPPPTSRDVFAVPAKLRKIMKLKLVVSKGQVAKKPVGGKSVKDLGVKGTRDTTNQRETEPNLGALDHPAKERKGPSVSTWKKREEELKRLIEKMDKREKIGIKQGFSDRRKSFLEEKKKKRKGKLPNADAVPALHQYEKIEFGDIVQAPPKLSFPKRAAEVKEKVKQRDDQAVMREKMRLAAIESYRQRKEASSSVGQHLRVLNFGLGKR